MFGRCDIRPEFKVTCSISDLDTGRPALCQGRLLAGLGELADLLDSLEVGLERVGGEPEMTQMRHG